MSASAVARRVVARNTLAQAAGKAVVLAAGAVSIAVTTRYLGAAGYGRFALALALLQTLGVLADAGLVAVVVREASRTPQRTAELVGNALAMRLALGVVVVALAAAASGLPSYGPDVRTAVLIAAVPFAIGLVSSSLAAVFQVRLQLGPRRARRRRRAASPSLAALLAVVAADLGFAAVVASTAVGAAVDARADVRASRAGWCACGRPPTARVWRELRARRRSRSGSRSPSPRSTSAPTRSSSRCRAPAARGRPLRARLPALRAARRCCRRW